MKNDKNTTIEELKRLVQEFCEVRDWDQFHNPKDLAIGISTESNELLDLFRFKTEEETNEMFKNKNKTLQIEEELADTLFFVIRFAQKYQIDLCKALVEKMKKNDENYPVDKIKGKNLKYNEI